MLTKGSFVQKTNTGQSNNIVSAQNNLDASFNNKNQTSGGQTPTKPVISFPINKNQVNSTQNTTSNSNVTVPRPESNNYQSTNINNLSQNNTVNQIQSNNAPSAFSNYQSNNINTNQNFASNSYNLSTANHLQAGANANSNQIQNAFSQSNNQNQFTQQTNQN